jgi:guanylate kinase
VEVPARAGFSGPAGDGRDGGRFGWIRLSHLAHKPVVVITGPSGAGKGSVIGLLAERIPELGVAVSATTRPRRPGEQDGREYYFLSVDDFTRRVKAGEFLEYVDYVSDHRYGTLRSELERIRDEGRVPVFELETEGALRVRETMPGTVTIFIDAPLEELERRLRERATESTGEIGERRAGEASAASGVRVRLRRRQQRSRPRRRRGRGHSPRRAGCRR